MDNLELVTLYNKLYRDIETVLSYHIRGDDIISFEITAILPLVDNTLGVIVQEEDGNIYTFKLTEDLIIIETE